MPLATDLQPDIEQEFAAMMEFRKGNFKAATLESKGWREWLQTIWPFWFSEEFSEDHVDFWDWFWSVLDRIKFKGHIELWELVCLLIL